jgi:Xaa-Pro aminopeptidase
VSAIPRGRTNAKPIIAALPKQPAPSIADQLERRRRASAAAWNLTNDVVVIGAGEQIPVPGRYDRTYPFRAHSEYLYLTDRERAGGVLTFDPQDGWLDFVVPISQHELLWAGAEGAEGSVPEGTLPISEFRGWLEKRAGRRIGNLGAPVASVNADAQLDEDLRYELDQVRRPKDEVELGRMRKAADATSRGFAALASLLAPGRTERELQIELECGFVRSGADGLAFETIVASGANSAVLHFAPTERRIGDGELVLVDAGGEFRGYASDVTRTYPASGVLDGEQRFLHSLVRAAGVAARERCTKGTEWREVHRTAALVIAEGLVEFGLLRGDAESLLEQGAVTLFFPHGVGHMVGLGVRDAGGVLRGRDTQEPGFPPLRVDLPLQPGYAMTVEPGVYFVPALLSDASNREQHDQTVDWERAERMLAFGGIRIEDNVLVTEEGYEVLTADIPVPGQ